MLPACLDPEAFFRTVTDCPGDRAQFRLGQADVQFDLARLVAARRGNLARGYGNGGDEAGGRDRPPQVEFQAPLVGIAGIEPGDRLQMLRRKEFRLVRRYPCEHVFAARLHRHRQVAFDPGMVDQQRRGLDYGEGITGLAEGSVEIELLFHDLVAGQKIARLDLESGAEFRVIGRLVQLPQVDRAEAVPRTRDDVEADLGRRLCGSVAIGIGGAVFRVDHHDGADDLGIVIAIDAQHSLQQFLVFARAGGQLRDIAVAIVIGLDRR